MAACQNIRQMLGLLHNLIYLALPIKILLKHLLTSLGVPRERTGSEGATKTDFSSDVMVSV